MESGLKVLQEIKNRTTRMIQHSHFWVNIPKKLKQYLRDICTSTLIITLTNSVHEWVEKMYTHMLEYDAAFKKKNPSVHHNMNEPWWRYSKWNKLVEDKYVWVLL
jgi:hypothetical protein